MSQREHSTIQLAHTIYYSTISPSLKLKLVVRRFSELCFTFNICSIVLIFIYSCIKCYYLIQLYINIKTIINSFLYQKDDIFV